MKNLEKLNICIFGLTCLFALQIIEDNRLDDPNTYTSFWMDTRKECSQHGNEHPGSRKGWAFLEHLRGC